MHSILITHANTVHTSHHGLSGMSVGPHTSFLSQSQDSIRVGLGGWRSRWDLDPASWTQAIMRWSGLVDDDTRGAPGKWVAVKYRAWQLSVPCPALPFTLLACVGLLPIPYSPPFLIKIIFDLPFLEQIQKIGWVGCFGSYSFDPYGFSF